MQSLSSEDLLDPIDIALLKKIQDLQPGDIHIPLRISPNNDDIEHFRNYYRLRIVDLRDPNIVDDADCDPQFY